MKKSKAVKIYNSIVNVLTLCITLMVAMLLISLLFGIQPYIVKSGSMEPSIPVGSLAFVNRKDTAVEVGDVITYSLENGDETVLITHRVIAIEDGQIHMKGDANDTEDFSAITQEQIVGTCCLNIPYMGYLMKYYNRRNAVILVIIITFLNASAYILKTEDRHI